MFVPTEQVLLAEKTNAMLDTLDKQALRRVLLNHVTQHAPVCDLRHKAELRTQDGSTLRITMFNPVSRSTLTTTTYLQNNIINTINELKVFFLVFIHVVYTF